jgi:mono/diheme cytochrome c family protein
MLPHPGSRRPLLAPTAAALLLATLAASCAGDAVPTTAPQRLAETGLFADPALRTVADDVLPFAPQYPLWTDGAQKRRWIALPPGTAVDASDAERWQFPAGTRLWKQFTFEHGVETRFMARRADGTWLYATYVRTPDGRDDVLAPDAGVRGFCATANGKSHDVPSIADCRACHEGAASPVLGFSALQLSSDRDPLAPHADAPTGTLDLAALINRGLVRDLPARHVTTAPRIAARTAAERAALGYLHGNCSNCHNAQGPLARLGLVLDHPLATDGPPPALLTTVGIASQFTRGSATLRIAPGDPDASVLLLRLAATDPLTQMPPFGRHLTDDVARDLFDRWIRTDLAVPSPSRPLTVSTKE